MPLYEFVCAICGTRQETLAETAELGPQCCNQLMQRVWAGRLIIKSGPPLWTGRIDEIHKAQADRGERLRFVGPAEVRAS